jgi:diacylglycerol kinase (ATP)
MKVTVIHNPDAGDDDTQPSGDRIIRLIRKAGHKTKYISTEDKKWEKALKKSCDIIAVAGGDGTIGKVAKYLVGSRTPIAVLPTGTANNIAHTIGVAGKTFEYLIEGWNTAHSVNFDVGVAKGPWGSKYFIEGFGVGLFAETMYRIDSGHHPHVLRAEDPEQENSEALKVLRKQLSSYRAKELTVRLDGQDLSGDYYMLEVLNVRYMGPNLDLVPRAETNDGVLDVVLVAKGDKAKLTGTFLIIYGTNAPVPAFRCAKDGTYRLSGKGLWFTLTTRPGPKIKMPTSFRPLQLILKSILELLCFSSLVIRAQCRRHSVMKQTIEKLFLGLPQCHPRGGF